MYKKLKRDARAELVFFPYLNLLIFCRSRWRRRRRCLSSLIEGFHMTSRRPYWCPKTMKRRPWPIRWELNSFLMQKLSVPINLHRCWPHESKHSIGSLSNDVVERRTSAESEPFSFLICLYATLFVLLSVFIPIETSCWKMCSKSQPKIAQSPLPVVVRCSKTSVLKLPITLLRSCVQSEPNPHESVKLESTFR